MDIKEGDYVKCIRNDTWEGHLTVGKKYKVHVVDTGEPAEHAEEDFLIVLKQDTGKFFAHRPVRFEKVEK